MNGSSLQPVQHLSRCISSLISRIIIASERCRQKHSDRQAQNLRDEFRVLRCHDATEKPSGSQHSSLSSWPDVTCSLLVGVVHAGVIAVRWGEVRCAIPWRRTWRWRTRSVLLATSMQAAAAAAAVWCCREARRSSVQTLWTNVSRSATLYTTQ